jgi:hypothetical protein
VFTTVNTIKSPNKEFKGMSVKIGYIKIIETELIEKIRRRM